MPFFSILCCYEYVFEPSATANVKHVCRRVRHQYKKSKVGAFFPAAQKAEKTFYAAVIKS